MLRLPRRECMSQPAVSHSNSNKAFGFTDLATPSQTRGLYLTLVTLLFSYAYECRTTQCDATPESPWTICNLTPAFSALDPPTSAVRPGETQSPTQPDLSLTKEELLTALISSYRRSLAFPLYRSFSLAEACKRDVTSLLNKGRRVIIRCLLEMKHILDHHEVYYKYSKIWVDDFCVWMQTSARCAFLPPTFDTLPYAHPCVCVQ